MMSIGDLREIAEYLKSRGVTVDNPPLGVTITQTCVALIRHIKELEAKAERK